MDHDDGADLLGTKELPVVPGHSDGVFSLGNTLTIFLCLGALLLIRFATVDGRVLWARYRERQNRLHIRRKYGIPDDDHDVFNVAYAKAKQRLADEEKKQRKNAPARPAKSTVNHDETSKAQPVASSSAPRRRVAPGAFEVVDDDSPILPQGPTFEPSASRAGQSSSRHDDPPTVISGQRGPLQESAKSPPPFRSTAQYQASRHDASASQPGSSDVRSRKQSFGKKDFPTSSTRKAIVEDDIDVEAEFGDMPMEVAEGEQSEFVPQKSKRGAKRQAGPDEDDQADLSKRKAEKRARRASRKSIATGLQPMEEDEGRDQLMDLDPISRGKKRDRAEAGSTFGGDDESPMDNRKKSRRRKRKSTATVDMDVDSESRGTKRSLDVESTLDSDDEELVRRVTHLRKRGKRAALNGDDSTDVSMDGSVTSKDPACGGRRIGEEWTVNGQLFKVGPDGRRLRQALVKKRRSRYSMPTDSHHPDSQAQLVVLVETWLDDDEYRAAEERGDTFSPKEAEVENNGDVEDTPLKNGKQLLWSTPPQKLAPAARKAFKDSIVTNVGLDLNPFEHPTYSSYARRVSAGATTFKPSPTASPVLRQSKSYSKWEKQDLEAEAMAKLRKRLEDQKKAETPEPKPTNSLLPASMSAPAVTGSLSAPGVMGSSLAQKASEPNSAASKPVFNPFALTSGASSAKDASKPATSNGSAAALPIAKETPTPASDQQSKSSMFSFASAPSAKDQSTTSASNQTPSIAPQLSSVPGFFGDKSKSSENDAASAPTSVPNFFSKSPALAAATSNGTVSNGLTIKGAGPTANSQTSTSTPIFSFGNSSSSLTVASKEPVKAAEPTNTSTGPSLLTRVGGFGSSAPAPQTTNPSAPSSTTGTSSPSPFSFAAPKAPSVPNPSPFGGDPQKAAVAASAASAAFTSSTSNAPSTSAPKFNFGFSPKPPTATPPPPPYTPEPPKPAAAAAAAPSPFKFSLSNPQPTSSVPSTAPTSNLFGPGANAAKAPAAAASATPSGNDASSTPSAAPKFSFNFGASGNVPAATVAANSGNSSGSSGFSFAKPSTATGSVFGNTPKAGDVPKPLFGFGAGSTTAQPTTPGGAAEKTDKPAFGFNFGAAPGSGTTSTPSAFGAASSTQPNASSNASSTSNPFGAKPFGSGAGPSPFGSTGGASLFGGSNIFGSKPSEAGSTSVFGAPSNASGATVPPNPFGSTSTFSFGAKPNASSEQK